MKKLLPGLLFSVGLAIAAAAWAQSYYNIYGPVAGVQYSTGSTPFNTAATAAQIASPFGCSGSQALTGSGGCSTTGGTVTSVGLTVPSWETVSGSPVTSSGTLAVTAATGQTANQFLATPNGSTGAVSLRAIVGADLPAINLAASGAGGVTGILPGANGGTANGFFAVSGPATSLKTFTFPNASATVLTTNAAVTPTQGGTGLTSYTLGDTLYASAANTLSALAGNTTSTKQFLSQTGTGTVSAAPTWSAITAANVSAPGSTTQMIYNNGGAFAGASNFTYTTATGDVAITAPTSGNAFTVTAASGSNAISVTGSANSYGQHIFSSSTSGQSLGLILDGGTTSADGPLLVRNQAGSATYMQIFGDGHGTLGPSSALGLAWTSGGAISIPAPSSGTAFSVTGVANTNTMNVQASSTTGQSLGLQSLAGTNSSDFAFRFYNFNGTNQILLGYGDGGVITGNPTGGDKGAGTLNTAGNIFINNVPLRITSVMIGATCTVNGACTLLSTNGFASVTRTGTGAYTAALTTNYNANPVCLIGSVLGSNTQNQTTINTTGVSGATVSTYNIPAAGALPALADAGFSLICQGN